MCLTFLHHFHLIDMIYTIASVCVHILIFTTQTSGWWLHLFTFSCSTIISPSELETNFNCLPFRAVGSSPRQSWRQTLRLWWQHPWWFPLMVSRRGHGPSHWDSHSIITLAPNVINAWMVRLANNKIILNIESFLSDSYSKNFHKYSMKNLKFTNDKIANPWIY